jgi:hypothetical protein
MEYFLIVAVLIFIFLTITSPLKGVENLFLKVSYFGMAVWASVLFFKLN